MTFKKNFNRGKKYSLTYVNKLIRKYPKKFPTPKYLQFIGKCIKIGLMVRVYKPKKGFSKYVFVYKNHNEIVKVRFSNHKPIEYKEKQEDCDYYVGISHFQVSTTEKIFDEVQKIFPQKPFGQKKS